MGCVSGKNVGEFPVEEDTPLEEYDDRWDKYRFSDYDNEGISDNEPSELKVCCSFAQGKLTARLSLMMTGFSASHVPRSVPKHPEPENLPQPSTELMQDIETAKVLKWLRQNQQQRDREARLQQSVNPRASLHTIYTDDEELIRSPVHGYHAPQRLTDQTCISRLQRQLVVSEQHRFQKARRKRNRNKYRSPEQDNEQPAEPNMLSDISGDETDGSGSPNTSIYNVPTPVSSEDERNSGAPTTPRTPCSPKPDNALP